MGRKEDKSDLESEESAFWKNATYRGGGNYSLCHYLWCKMQGLEAASYQALSRTTERRTCRLRMQLNPWQTDLHGQALRATTTIQFESSARCNLLDTALCIPTHLDKILSPPGFFFSCGSKYRPNLQGINHYILSIKPSSGINYSLAPPLPTIKNILNE